MRRCIVCAWLRLLGCCWSDVVLTTGHPSQVMGLVELQTLSGALVGRPGQTGLSVEQRKRLTIAVELVSPV